MYNGSLEWNKIMYHLPNSKSLLIPFYELGKQRKLQLN